LLFLAYWISYEGHGVAEVKWGRGLVVCWATL